MTLRALLFDVDGTLADTEEVHRQAFNEMFRAHGLPYAWSRAEYGVLLGTTGGKERLVRYFNGLELPPGERARVEALVPSLHGAKNERYAALVAAGRAELRPGIRRLFDEASAAGVTLGIATTTSESNVHALLGPETCRRFAVLACGDMVAAKKPAPDIYRYALAKIECAAADAIAFEDSANGLAAARGAGLFTVVTPTAWAEGQDLSAADLLLPHLGDPEIPLDGDAARRAGGPFLTLATLAALRA